MQHLAKVLVAIAALSISSLSSAYTINDEVTNVGSLDTFLGVSNSLPNSNAVSEAAFLNGLIDPLDLSPDLAQAWRTDPGTYYQTDDDSNVFAFDLHGTPGYFILKNARYWAAYQNVSSFGWAVFDVSAIGVDMNLGEGEGEDGEWTISHVSEFGNACLDCVPDPRGIPEPATLGLLGLGLIGLAASRRRLI